MQQRDGYAELVRILKVTQCRVESPHPSFKT